MNLENLSYFATVLGVGIVLIGTMIFYFGRIVLKSRKELTKDITSEVLAGILFLVDTIIIPFVIVYAVYFIIINNSSVNLWFVVLGAFFIVIQEILILRPYEKILNAPGGKTKRWANYLSSFYLIAIAIFFVLAKNWLFLSITLLMDFLIYTYMASRDHFRNEDNSRDGKLLKVKLNSQKRQLKLKIVRLGDDFIDFEDSSGNKITMNKSDILSVRD